MKIVKPLFSINTIIYLSIFIVTQVTGLLVSLSVCYVLQDFIWGFMWMALINSLILGTSLIICCILSQTLLTKMKVQYIVFICLSLILGTSIISLFVLLYSTPTLFIYYSRGAMAFIFINFLFIITLYSISSGLILYREVMIQKEKTIGQERFLKNQMELKLLSSKVNPHFLFNTLNMILNLLKKPKIAEEAILNLSDLLRNNLDYSELRTIPIEDEIANVKKYLTIQKLRFQDKLSYSIEGSGSFSIPPLIIQPLVENCIKHNISKVNTLSITITFASKESRHIVSIVDSAKQVHPSMLEKGQGLTITKKRVENSSGTFDFVKGGIEISFGND